VNFERLVIEAGENTFTLDIHPRMTVIAGVGRLEREGLVSELIGALGPSRAGVHLEVTEGTGRHLAVFRPFGGRHRVVDIDQGLDLSAEYVATDGTIDLLARAGFDLRSAKRYLRLTAADLTASSQGDLNVRALADVDQQRLWAAARKVREVDDVLQHEAEATGSAPEDAEIIERIEERHDAFLTAQARFERTRRTSFFSAAFAVLAAVPVAMLESTELAMVFVAYAAIATILSFLEWRGAEKTAKEEEEALSEAGAASYLGFHLQRVNGLVNSDQGRRRLVRAAEAFRTAMAEWQELAGDVPVEWAIEHAEAIMGAARRNVPQTGFQPVTASTPDLSNAMAQSLVARLTQLRAIGPAREAFPLVLDDPLTDLEGSAKAPLLELISRASLEQQIIFLTQDEDVASWARVEAMTGALSIFEPSVTHGGGSDGGNGESHVAA
jgi:hypothetical protein